MLKPKIYIKFIYFQNQFIIDFIIYTKSNIYLFNNFINHKVIFYSFLFKDFVNNTKS